MILRKPYAFLIKYFKVFHIIMFICFSYFVFVLRKIYFFFADYVKASNFTYFENMTSRYIPTIVFFLLVLLLAMAIGIFLLMRKKDKPVLFYRVLIIYCSALLIAFIYFLTFFNSLDNTVYEPLRVVINRDISLGLYIVNFFYVAFSFIRGFGFDIKKFSFDKDKKELNLEESDSEEYELNVNIEKEDVVNYFNKQRREFKYYLKENSLILSIIGIVILVGSGIYIYLNYFVVNKIYKEKEVIDSNGLIYQVNSSHITNIDKYGKVLGSNYLIVNLSITNNIATGYLDNQAFRVNIDDEYYYPLTSTCDLFDDLGECYNNQQLKVNTNYNYILAYKIGITNSKMHFEILKNKADEYKYRKVLLEPKTYAKEKITYNKTDSFKIGENEHKINKYELLDKTSYQYEECNNGSCNKFTKTVTPKLGEKVLVLDVENLDKLTDEFLNRAVGLIYDNKTYYGSDIKLIDRHNSIAYFSVSNSIKDTNLVLVITMRDKSYNITLNGGV